MARNLGRKIVLAFVALVLVALGAFGGYVALTVPNDIKAESLLKHARDEIAQGERDEARQTLEKIVRNHPRTDAAATAMQSLFRMLDQDRAAIEARLERERTAQKKELTALENRLTQLERRPVPKAPTITKPAPSRKPATVKKKPTPKRTPTRRRRR